MTSYRDLLKREFASRKSANAHYSMRAFARDLAMSPGQLSMVLSGKSGLSQEKAKALAAQLKLSLEEEDRFLAMVEGEHGRSEAKRKRAKNYLLKKNKEVVLEDATFSLISEWHYTGILCAMMLDDFNGEAKNIAERLGLSLEKVGASLNRLVELGLVSHKEGKYVLLQKHIATKTDFPSLALRHAHKQGLERAIRAIDEVPVHERDVTSITMAIDREKLPEAKMLIKRFRRELSHFLESGPRNSIYSLNIQLTPNTLLEDL